MKPSGTITAFSLDLLAVLPVEAEAEDVPEEAAPPQPQTACMSSMADKRMANLRCRRLQSKNRTRLLNPGSA